MTSDWYLVVDTWYQMTGDWLPGAWASDARLTGDLLPGNTLPGWQVTGWPVSGDLYPVVDTCYQMTGTGYLVPGHPIYYQAIHCLFVQWLVDWIVVTGAWLIGDNLPGAWLSSVWLPSAWLTNAWWSWLLPGEESQWLVDRWLVPGGHTMGAFKPLMLPPNGSYSGSIALRGGAPI